MQLDFFVRPHGMLQQWHLRAADRQMTGLHLDVYYIPYLADVLRQMLHDIIRSFSTSIL